MGLAFASAHVDLLRGVSGDGLVRRVQEQHVQLPHDVPGVGFRGRHLVIQVDVQYQLRLVRVDCITLFLVDRGPEVHVDLVESAQRVDSAHCPDSHGA